MITLKTSQSTGYGWRTIARCAAKYWIVVSASAVTLWRSLVAGTDAYYDFLNVKWFMGWQLWNANFELAGIASSRKWGPPFLDIWHAALANTGVWWVPALVHGAVHALIAPSVFLLSRAVVRGLPNILHQAFAAVSVLVPLVAMQIGTTSGHLYAALPIVWSLTLLARSRETDNSYSGQSCSNPQQTRGLAWAGAVLAVSPLLKPSALASMPAHFIGVPFLTGSLVGSIAFLLGFLAVYLAVAVTWAAVVALATDGGLLEIRTPGVPVDGFELWFLAGTLVAALFGLLNYSEWVSFLHRSLRPRRVVALLTLVAALGALVAATHLRSAAYDGRWFVDDPASFVPRLSHTGDLQYGFNTLDLEVPYFDTSVPLAALLAVAGIVVAVGVMLRDSWWQDRWTAGLVLFSCAPFVFNVWATGYTRYATQSIPLIGVAALSMCSLRGWRPLKLFVAALFLIAWTLPLWWAGRTSTSFERFAQITYEQNIYEDIVNDEEVELLSDLIPDGSTVFVVGDLTSHVIPRLGRFDVTWDFLLPKGDAVAELRTPPVLLFNPAESDRLSKYEDQGLILESCDVLRFRHVSLGLCTTQIDRSQIDRA